MKYEVEAVKPCAPPGHFTCSGKGGTDALDRALMELVAQRDHAAFSELHARYRRRVARFVSRFTARRDMIDEITNDTLWAVWKSAASYQGSSKVSTWILGIAYHVSHRSIRNVMRSESDTYFVEEVHEPWSRSEEREWLNAGLAQLPPAQRTVLELAYLFGHSCEEIAQSESCPVNTVKTRMFHGRRKMRLLLRLAALR
jgi:RNA polymerase sigma-70 factor (ECF subfamily)